VNKGCEPTESSKTEKQHTNAAKPILLAPAVTRELQHALLAYQQGAYEQAEQHCCQALDQGAEVPHLHNTHGVILEALGRYDEAIAAQQRAVTLQPDYGEAWVNLAITLQLTGALDPAVAACQEALKINPQSSAAFYTLGSCRFAQEQYDQAIDAFQQCIRICPEHVDATNQMGMALAALERYDEAIPYYRKALSYDSEPAEFYNNLGIALRKTGQHAEAVAHYQQALERDPASAVTHYNLANALQEMGVLERALHHFDRALALDPDYADAHWNRGLCHLLHGDFTSGWQGYLWRTRALPAQDLFPHVYTQPAWDGSSFAGQRLLVHSEQGLGDTLQFARYLPLVKQRGGTVLVETWPELVALVQSIPDVDTVHAISHEPLAESQFELCASIMDLPRLMGTTVATVPAEVPYLQIDPERLRHWQARLQHPELTVGLVWAGRPTHGNDKNRSCHLCDFLPLLDIPGLRFYGLQKGPAAAQIKELPTARSLENLADAFDDLMDAGAAISALDLIISVDTALAHLAGGLGKTVWTLLPHAPDWRWMRDRNDSPWYPTMRLIRQSQPGDWPSVFSQAADLLQRLTGTQKQPPAPQKPRTPTPLPTIIPIFGKPEQVAKCMDHLEKQTQPVDIFLRDNNRENIFFTAAVNEGILRFLSTDGAYMLILNQDMYLEPGAVEAMVTFMESHPRCGIGCPLEQPAHNAQGRVLAGGLQAFPTGHHLMGPRAQFAHDAQIHWANGSCMILRKTMIQEIGLFDKNYIFIGSDSDYSFMARSRGWEVWRIGAACGVHEHGASGTTENPEIQLLKIKDMLYFGNKWLTGGLYRQLAHEPNKYSMQDISSFMSQLQQAKEEYTRG